ncbi:MAG TPA: heavy metal-binding domain-containing protein [Polyangiaceae bacterium]
MIVTSGSDVAGHAVSEYLGVVRGIVVCVPTRRQRIRGTTDAFVEGGDNRYFLEVAVAVRDDAWAAMVKHAESLGADAVIGARWQTTPFAREGVTEGLAYGTAVRLARLP